MSKNSDLDLDILTLVPLSIFLLPECRALNIQTCINLFSRHALHFYLCMKVQKKQRVR